MKFNVPVQMSCHPELNSYLSDMVDACRPDIQRGVVDVIALNIVDAHYNPVERFVFEINSLIPQHFVDQNLEFERSITLEEIESHLRSFILKIAICESMLQPNPKNCTFALAMQLKDGEPTEINGAPWISEDSVMKRLDMKNNSMIPLKSVDLGLINIQLYVEETAKKGKQES